MTTTQDPFSSNPGDGAASGSMQRRALLAAAGGLAAGVALARTAAAGPLDPPAGPVTSTGKTLSEVEPRIAINATNTPGDATSLFRITQPGSYYLPGNITGVAGKHGIVVAANGVTIDLMGFDVAGVAGMGSFHGIASSGTQRRDIAVINGSVRNWGGSGVDLGGTVGRECTISNIRASGNVAHGISVGFACVVTDCTSSSNGSMGIFASQNCTIIGCVCRLNTFAGIHAGYGGSVADCVAQGNTDSGIKADNGATITRCASFGNNFAGINVGNGCTISNCAAASNAQTGILTGNGCTVTGCTADSNSNGVSSGTGSTISNCTVRNNQLDGILLTAQCSVVGNTCASNGFSLGNGAGIHVTGSDNRIEGNNCTGADRGIDVDSPGNIIIRNTCSGNTTNWDIVANNVVGPIVDRSSPGSAAILGNSAPDSTGSTHPNANFTY